MPDVRISVATPRADLAASVWPGVESVCCPRVESAEYVAEVEAVITTLEKRRGIRPGTVRIRPLIESSRGVSMAMEIAGGSSRIDTLGLGPNVELELGGDSLAYARGECELSARSLDVAHADLEGILD